MEVLSQYPLFPDLDHVAERSAGGHALPAAAPRRIQWLEHGAPALHAERASDNGLLVIEKWLENVEKN